MPQTLIIGHVKRSKGRTPSREEYTFGAIEAVMNFAILWHERHIRNGRENPTRTSRRDRQQICECLNGSFRLFSFWFRYEYVPIAGDLWGSLQGNNGTHQEEMI